MKTRGVRFVWLLFVVAPVLTASLAEGRAEARSIRDLGTLGGSSSFARGINQAGQIVGDATTARGDTHAFLFTPWVGRLQDLGTLGGRFARAEAINDGGQVVGQSSTPADDQAGGGHAFIWQSGTMRALPSLPGAFASEATAINGQGQVVGSSNSRPVIWQNGTVRALFGVNAIGFATGINANGDIVGNVSQGDGNFHAFLIRNGVATNLDNVVGPQSSADAVTDNGNVVGGFTPAGSESPHAYLYNFFTNQVIDLGRLGAFALAHAVSSSGLVTGESGTETSHAALWDNNHVVHDLGTLAGGGTSAGFGVNNGGIVVGFSSTATFDTHAVVWLP